MRVTWTTSRLVPICLGLLIAATVIASSFPGTCAPKPRHIADIAVAPWGSVYVLDSARDEVLSFDKAGTFRWKVSLAGPSGAASGAYRMRIDCYGRLECVRDSTDVLIIMDARDRGSIDSRTGPLPAGSMSAVTDVDATGGTYVPDREHNRVKIHKVIIYNADPSKMTEKERKADREWWASLGPLDFVIDGDQGGFSGPVRVDLAFANIYVLDKSHTYKVFDPKGKFLCEIKAPDKADKAFARVEDVEVSSTFIKGTAKNSVLIACRETKNVLQYDMKGKLMKTIPLPAEPCGFGMGSDGLVYVGDDAGRAITVLDQQGKVQRTVLLPE